MHKPFALGVLMLCAVAGFGAYQWSVVRDAAHERGADTNAGRMAQGVSYAHEKYGISFSYPSEYELSEFLNDGSAQREHYTIVLTRADDLPLPDAGEGPPTITFDIYQNNLDSQTTEQWIGNTAASNYKQSADGTLAATSVDGKDALMYRWDGLYTGTTIALAEPDWVYALSVQYMSPEDDIVRDFAEIVQTVRISD